jgi:hypothetical protein
MTRKLTIWNGRHPSCRGSVYAAGYTKKQVMEMLELAYETGRASSWNKELDVYWHKGAWGNAMEGITPEVGVWEQADRYDSPVMRVIDADGKLLKKPQVCKTGKMKEEKPVERKMQTDDDVVFGSREWVYCAGHLRPHQTGWCTVGIRDKVALGVDNAKDAYEKCKRLGLKIFKG